MTGIRKHVAPFLGLAFVVLLFAVLAPPQFGTFYNAKTIITQSVLIGVGALGMTLVIIGGGIDLSPGSQIALCTVVVATLLNLLGGGTGGQAGVWITLLAACGGLAACGLCGLANGWIITRFRIVPFIVTLGMMQIARGLAKWLGREQTVLTPVNWLQRCMDVDPSPAWLVLAPGVWLMLALAGVTALVLNRTVFGRYVFAVGSNEQTARLCGVPVDRIRVWMYLLGGLAAGVAGVMQYANLTVGDPTAAGGMELDIIAAVIIGGGSLSGGEGGVRGTMMGALIMAVLRNGCNMLGVPTYVQDILIGAIIIGAVATDRFRDRPASAG